VDALTLAGVTKRWPKAPAPVLADVSISVAPGETVGIVGRNGAGKTTLLRIAAGLLEPETGSVRIAGLDPRRQRTEAQRRIGVCSAGNTGLYGRLGVRSHLELWSRIALMSRADRQRAIPRALSEFALEEFGDRRVDRMSMGQRQRLRLALAFLHEPELLLLDEPRTSLDSEGWEIVCGAIASAVARGGAAVVCSPSGEDQVLRFDRVCTIADARLVQAA
jgi:ABC-2 type transport system ATP-binding protein